MYIANHGVTKKIIEQVFEYSKFIFDLPLEIKQKISWKDVLTLEGVQGSVAMETEDYNPDKPSDLKEALNIFNLDKFPNNFFVAPAMPTLLKACTEVANNTLQVIFLALELPQDFLTSKHNHQSHGLRLLHYPALQ